jgi:hypothetical protein
MSISDEMIDRAARADADFAGRTFDALGAVDKVRFRDRAKLMLEAGISAQEEVVTGTEYVPIGFVSIHPDPKWGRVIYFSQVLPKGNIDWQQAYVVSNFSRQESSHAD